MSRLQISLLALVVHVITPSFGYSLMANNQIDLNQNKITAPYVNTSQQIPMERRFFAFCPPHFHFLANMCYFVSEKRESWLEGHFACQEKRSKLVEPVRGHDRKLRAYLQRKYPSNQPQEPFWMGASLDWNRGVWQWGISGKNLTYDAFDPSVNIKDLREHCAVFDPTLDYRWSARLCPEKNRFICQRLPRRISGRNRMDMYRKWNATYPHEYANEVMLPIRHNGKFRRNQRLTNSKESRDNLRHIPHKNAQLPSADTQRERNSENTAHNLMRTTSMHPPSENEVLPVPQRGVYTDYDRKMQIQREREQERLRKKAERRRRQKLERQQLQRLRLEQQRREREEQLRQQQQEKEHQRRLEEQRREEQQPMEENYQESRIVEGRVSPSWNQAAEEHKEDPRRMIKQREPARRLQEQYREEQLREEREKKRKVEEEERQQYEENRRLEHMRLRQEEELERQRQEEERQKQRQEEERLRQLQEQKLRRQRQEEERERQRQEEEQLRQLQEEERRQQQQQEETARRYEEEKRKRLEEEIQRRQEMEQKRYENPETSSMKPVRLSQKAQKADEEVHQKLEDARKQYASRISSLPKEERDLFLAMRKLRKAQKMKNKRLENQQQE